jgi:hypothetical protein
MRSLERSQSAFWKRPSAALTALSRFLTFLIYGETVMVATLKQPMIYDHSKPHNLADEQREELMAMAIASR